MTIKLTQPNNRIISSLISNSYKFRTTHTYTLAINTVYFFKWRKI